MTYKNGNIYKGFWENNKKNGKGFLLQTNGDYYNG